MKYDREITISAAGSRKATSWPAQKMFWSDFAGKLQLPTRGTETLAQYLKYPKSRQDDLKDVGGFIGGLASGSRKADHILGRDLVTLDLDSIPPGETDAVIRILESLGCGYCCYSTRKHEPQRPRLRVIIPLSRTCSADEYEPIARKLAGIIGIDYADPTTFQASRLMYWPSCCKDSQYVYRQSDKPMADPDGLLALYKDWHDVSEWPQQPQEELTRQRLVKRQGDPLAKNGIVGAFCREYSIQRAMEELIPGEYAPTEREGRYTYVGGSTTGGAVVYEDGKFLFSHHATDPCSGKLVNAFDLVRLHKFSDQDEEAVSGTPTNRLPSYTAMCKFASGIDEVSSLLKTERYEKAAEAFGTEVPEAEDNEWVKTLTMDQTPGGGFDKTIDNVVIILQHDPMLKGRYAFNEFLGCVQARGQLPWNAKDGIREWTDDDDAGLRHYIEKMYQISGKDRVYDALINAAHQNTVDDIRGYFAELPSWDGVKRLDSLLIDYLGAEDTVYTRAIIRKSLIAAVARTFEPGIKYDYMLILSGPQGIGKSTFFRILGGEWYSDNFLTFEGKEAAEQIQGRWIVEIAELSAMGQSRTEVMKLFLSRQEDIYRKAYGRRTNRYPRRCVIFGTTNDEEFLKDSTGNRRFWPLSVPGGGSKDVFTQLEAERDQIWAEALAGYRAGEQLYLTGEAEKISRGQQESHSEGNAKKGIIIEFLMNEVPENWNELGAEERRLWLMSGFDHSKDKTVKRDRISALEIWYELFGGEVRNLRKSDAREINQILENIPGLIRSQKTQRFGPYGVQRGFDITADFFVTFSVTFEKTNVTKNKKPSVSNDNAVTNKMLQPS